jgi:hypothetical protein
MPRKLTFYLPGDQYSSNDHDNDLACCDRLDRLCRSAKQRESGQVTKTLPQSWDARVSFLFHFQCDSNT